MTYPVTFFLTPEQLDLLGISPEPSVPASGASRRVLGQFESTGITDEAYDEGFVRFGPGENEYFCVLHKPLSQATVYTRTGSREFRTNIELRPEE